MPELDTHKKKIRQTVRNIKWLYLTYTLCKAVSLHSGSILAENTAYTINKIKHFKKTRQGLNEFFEAIKRVLSKVMKTVVNIQVLENCMHSSSQEKHLLLIFGK